MVNDYHWMLAQTQGLGAQLGGVSEGLGDYRNRGPPPLFSFYSVVETPRCAGPSIGHGVDNSITLFSKLVHHLIWGRHALADLFIADHLGNAVFFLKHPAQLGQKHVQWSPLEGR